MGNVIKESWKVPEYVDEETTSAGICSREKKIRLDVILRGEGRQ